MNGLLHGAATIAGRGRVRASSLRSEPVLRERADKLAETFSGAGRPPQPVDLDLIRRKLMEAAQGADFAPITDRDWRKAAWVLFDGTPGSTLAENAAVFQTYQRWLGGRDRRSDYQRLIGAWLHAFNPVRYSEGAARLIRRACEHWPDWPWAQRHQLHALFSAKSGPAALAEAVFDSTEPVSVALKKTGFSEFLQTGGYAQEVCRHLMTRSGRQIALAQSEARALQILQRLADWAAPAPGTSLRFPSTKEKLAESLLLPWESGVDPPTNVKRGLTGLLVGALSDPRIEPAKWFGIDERVTALLRRWLVGETIESFIRIISRTADPRHWQHRRDFWMRYYKAGHIAEAWVALGSQGQALAMGDDNLRRSHGRLSGDAVLGNHSVLLMRIGDLVIADWSHNGKCRINNRSDQAAPKLYQGDYKGRELRYSRTGALGAELGAFVHHGSDTWGWQARVSEAIHRNTRIAFPD